MKSPESKQSKVYLDDFEIRLLNRVKDETIDETGRIAKGDDVGTKIITSDLENLLIKARLEQILEDFKKQLKDNVITEAFYIKSLILTIRQSKELEKENIERSGVRNVVPPPDITPQYTTIDLDNIKKSAEEALVENDVNSLKLWVKNKTKKSGDEQ